MRVDLQEFRAAYLAEVDEHLASISERLLEVDRATRAGEASPRALRELMRLLHTVKGLSAMVGIEPIVTIAHKMETALRDADRSGGKTSAHALEALFAGAHAIQVRVAAIGKNQEVEAAPEKLLGALEELEAPPPSASPRALPIDSEISGRLSESEKRQLSDGAQRMGTAYRVDFVPSPARAAAGLTITTVRGKLAPLGEIVKVIPIATTPEATPTGLLFAILMVSDLGPSALADAIGVDAGSIRVIATANALVPDEPAVESADSTGDLQRPGVLRVEVSRIEDTLEKLSALIVTRWRLARAVDALTATGVDTRELRAVMFDNGRQIRDLRAAILRVRMVAIAAVLDRLPLVVRGLGRSTGKQVKLVVEGGSAELDKTVAERIFPPLLHLVRNAVDHGIETPEERQRLGKPPQGTIAITAVSRSNRQLEIRVSDDGRGIDRARVAAKVGHDVDDDALLDVLCRAGMSTREEVSTTSGRGIGMDVVRKVIVDSLAGELALETAAGVGTTFVLRVPLTIAIVDAFTLKCGDERFVVPVPAVDEIVEIERDKLVRGPSASSRFFARRGQVVPLVDLAHALGLGARKVTEGTTKALVVRRGGDDPVAFSIDRVLGQQETVVRPLVDPLVTVPGVSGSTDLGDGKATLVLDLHGLCARLGIGERAA